MSTNKNYDAVFEPMELTPWAAPAKSTQIHTKQICMMLGFFFCFFLFWLGVGFNTRHGNIVINFVSIRLKWPKLRKPKWNAWCNSSIDFWLILAERMDFDKNWPKRPKFLKILRLLKCCGECVQTFILKVINFYSYENYA